MKRLKAIWLGVAMVAVLAAAALPACLPAVCCAAAPGEEANVHAMMPCCAEPTMAARDLPTVRLAPIAGTTAAADALVPTVVGPAPAPPRISASHVVPLAVHGEPPPLFLLNAQFLI